MVAACRGPVLRPRSARVLQGGVPRTPAWLRVIWIGLALCLVALLVVQLRAVLAPILFAFLLAYVLDPLVDHFERMRIPRALGIAIILFVAILALTSFVILVVPQLVRDVTELLRALSKGIVSFLGAVQPWLIAHKVPVPDSVASALDQVGDNLLATASSA